MLNTSTCTAINTKTHNTVRTICSLATGLLLGGYLLTLEMATVYAASPDQGSTPQISRSTVEHHINMAERLLDKENYGEAIRNLNITVKRYRHNPDAWNLLGYAHRQSGNTDAANAAYARALSMDRYHLGALEYQGELFIELGKLDDAKINLRLMSERCPTGCKEQRDLEAAITAVK